MTDKTKQDQLDEMLFTWFTESLHKNTPCTIINDYAAKKYTTFQFSLVHHNDGYLDANFQYELTLDDFKSVGEGNSKQIAKQAASLKMIEKILGSKSQLLLNQFQKSDSYAHMVYLCASKNTKPVGDPVGELIKFCRSNYLSFPEFTLVYEEGQSHAKKFTVSCRVGKISEKATNVSKKLAKCDCASQMIDKLSKMELSPLSNTTKSDYFKLLKEEENIKAKNFTTKEILLHDDLSNNQYIENTSLKFDPSNKLLEVYSSTKKLNNSQEIPQKVDQDCKIELVKQNTRPNHVGALIKCCKTYRLACPEYTLVHEEGKPHAKKFTVSCKVGEMSEKATNISKKLAKCDSAGQMMDKLLKMYFSPLSNTTKSDSEVLKEEEKIKARDFFTKENLLHDDLSNNQFIGNTSLKKVNIIDELIYYCNKEKRWMLPVLEMDRNAPERRSGSLY